MNISPRIRAAVELLAPGPHETLLEIGCGTGQAIAAALLVEPTVQIAAIDRSARAVVRARIVNREAIHARRVKVMIGDIERGVAKTGSFDRVFAIRVNTFWTKPGLALPHVIASLRPGGSFWIIYDGAATKVVGPILRSLEGYPTVNIRTQSSPGAFAIVGELPRP